MAMERNVGLLVEGAWMFFSRICPAEFIEKYVSLRHVYFVYSAQ